MTPTFIRFFCETDGRSPTSELGWNFMRRMIRIRQVLVASLTSPQMGGRWVGYESLRITPQVGSFVNVVCAQPERWTWLAKVPAPTTDITAHELAAGDDATVEMVSARMELWTAKVRNVLIAQEAPHTQPEIETAKKYDAVIVTNYSLFERFQRFGIFATEIAHPYADRAVRDAILGAP